MSYLCSLHWLRGLYFDLSRNVLYSHVAELREQEAAHVNVLAMLVQGILVALRAPIVFHVPDVLHVRDILVVAVLNLLIIPLGTQSGGTVTLLDLTGGIFAFTPIRLFLELLLLVIMWIQFIIPLFSALFFGTVRLLSTTLRSNSLLHQILRLPVA